MNGARLGWLLVVAAFAAGYVSYGWPGVALAATATVFWLLLQFNRSVRVLKDAGSRPKGRVGNAVMLHARLQPGMTLPQVLKLTRSLGHELPASERPAEHAAAEDAFFWADDHGDEVRVVLQAGRLVAHELRRAPRPDAPAPSPAEAPPAA